MTLAVGAKYWQAVDMSASPLLGPPLRCPYNGRLWADFTWTGAPTGLFALQARTGSGPWFDVPGAAAGFTQPSGAAQVAPAPSNWVNVPGTEFRFTYTGAGAGLVTANVGFGDVQET